MKSWPFPCLASMRLRYNFLLFIVALATTCNWIVSLSARPIPATGPPLNSSIADPSPPAVPLHGRGIFGSVAKSISNASKSVASHCCTFGSYSVSAHSSDFGSHKSSLGLSGSSKDGGGSGSTSSSHLSIPSRLLPSVSPTHYSKPRESLALSDDHTRHGSPLRPPGPIRIGNGHETPPTPGSPLSSATSSPPSKGKGKAALSSQSSSSGSPGWHPAPGAGPSSTSHGKRAHMDGRDATIDTHIQHQVRRADARSGSGRRGFMKSVAKTFGSFCSAGSGSGAGSTSGSSHPTRPATQSPAHASSPSTPHSTPPSHGLNLMSSYFRSSTPPHQMPIMVDSSPESRPNFSSSGSSGRSSHSSFLSEPRHDWPVTAPSVHSSSLSPHSSSPPSSVHSYSPPGWRSIRIGTAEQTKGPARYTKEAAAHDARVAAQFAASSNGKGKTPIQASGWGTSSSSSSSGHNSPPHSAAGTSGTKHHRRIPS